MATSTNVNNGMNKKTLANIKKQATTFLGGFRASCMAILEVANGGDADAKKTLRVFRHQCRKHQKQKY